MGVLDAMKWCGSRPPAAGDYQWELFDDPDGSTFGALKELYSELISLFPDNYFHVGGDEVKGIGPCTVNGSLHSLEHKILRLLKANGKTPYGWSELLLVTDGTEGYADTVLSAWKGGDSNSSAAAIIGRGHRCVNSNSTSYYLGWMGNKNPDKSPGAPASLGIGISDAYLLRGMCVCVCVCVYIYMCIYIYIYIHTFCSHIYIYGNIIATVCPWFGSNLDTFSPE